MDPFESLVERQIREAQERGEFDNLPGAGKPLRGLDGREDPDWWVKQMMQREGLDMADALPPVMGLRKEAAGFPHSLLDLRTEESVRAVLEDFNRRVRLDRLRPAVGPFPPMLARTVDVDELTTQWKALRAELQAAKGAQRQWQSPRDAAEADPCVRPGSRGWCHCCGALDPCHACVARPALSALRCHTPAVESFIRSKGTWHRCNDGPEGGEMARDRIGSSRGRAVPVAAPVRSRPR